MSQGRLSRYSWSCCAGASQPRTVLLQSQASLHSRTDTGGQNYRAFGFLCEFDDGSLGVPGLIGASDIIFLMNPGGTVAVKIARSPERSIFRLSKKVFTSTSDPWLPMLVSAE